MTTWPVRRSIRQVYGDTLVELGECDERIVVVDADMAPGTFTYMFRDRFPERFFDVGIAEQNLVDFGVGFALGGHIPFVNTFAFLLALRAAEQVRTSVCWARANVKIAARSASTRRVSRCASPRARDASRCQRHTPSPHSARLR